MDLPPPTTLAVAVADFLPFLLSGGFLTINEYNLCFGSIIEILPHALQSLSNESFPFKTISVSGFLQDPHKTNLLIKPSNESCNSFESCAPLTKYLSFKIWV